MSLIDRRSGSFIDSLPIPQSLVETFGFCGMISSDPTPSLLTLVERFSGPIKKRWTEVGAGGTDGVLDVTFLYFSGFLEFYSYHDHPVF